MRPQTTTKAGAVFLQISRYPLVPFCPRPGPSLGATSRDRTCILIAGVFAGTPYPRSPLVFGSSFLLCARASVVGLLPVLHSRMPHRGNPQASGADAQGHLPRVQLGSTRAPQGVSNTVRGTSTPTHVTSDARSIDCNGDPCNRRRPATRGLRERQRWPRGNTRRRVAASVSQWDVVDSLSRSMRLVWVCCGRQRARAPSS